MMYSVKIIFGKEQTNKFLSDMPFSKEKKIINEKVYNFKTQCEIDAFTKGVNETIGWLECFIIENTYTNEF